MESLLKKLFGGSDRGLQKPDDPLISGEDGMYVIAGLGNPGKDYEKTRHNMGFMVIDRLAEKRDIPVKRLKHRALVGDGRIGGKRVLLVKPQTYMNNSGQSLGEICRYYHVEPEELIVIYDDMDLPTGSIRIRKKGGPGTHNGMKSVVSHVGSEDFPRIRIGIGGASSDQWRDFVLDAVSREDAQKLADALDRAADAIVTILEDGIDIAMNRWNEKKPKKARKPKKEDAPAGEETAAESEQE